jgi:hypothetical protein
VPIASELLRHGRNEELWQMCCGFLDLDIQQFMEIQERLLVKQMETLSNCQLGQKLMRGKKPTNIEEFRRLVPLTNYKDYCPELSEKMVETLPGQPELWAHSSGRSGDYACKWVPLTKEYIDHLSVILYGIGMLSCAREKGDSSRIPRDAKLLYCVAPRPYISGTFADILRMQTPLEYLPSLEEAENMTYEDRIGAGFQQALSKGLDYFFGLSLVLVKVGEKLAANSQKISIKPYIKQPKALWRLSKALVKSKLAGRPMMPKDIWDIKGIMCSGLDSWVYKDKIRELWGRNPLDIYSCTEGGILAMQAWDYDGMTFIPNMNFLEFIPEEEQLKNEMDRSYQPKTLLLNEVRVGESYEVVITSFHGGSLVRYRIGDMVKITSLTNETCGIKTPQMVFEQRVDGILDFYVVRITEKTIWQAIEKTGVPYIDWIAYRLPGETVLRILIELKNNTKANEKVLADVIRQHIMETSDEKARFLKEDFVDVVGFDVEVGFLKAGTFDGYIAQRQKEGADIAHIKPPHINPSEETLNVLSGKTLNIIEINTIASAGSVKTD